MIRARLFVGWLLAVGLLAAGCSDDASPFSSTTTTAAPTTTAAVSTTAEPATTTSTAAVTTTEPVTTTAAATTTAATTSTTTGPTGCPGPGAGPIPAGAGEISSRAAMLDGDGLTDTFSAYYHAGAWQLHADLGTGVTARLVLDDAWAAVHWPLGVGNVAVERAHGLGSAEQVVLVRIYTGLVAAYAFFAFEDCRIVALTGPDGRLPDLWVGMGPAHSDWPVCGPGASVFQVVFSSPEGCGDLSTCGTPNLATTEYRVQRHPARLVYVGEESWVSNPPEREYLLSQSCLP